MSTQRYIALATLHSFSFITNTLYIRKYSKASALSSKIILIQKTKKHLLSLHDEAQDCSGVRCSDDHSTVSTDAVQWHSLEQHTPSWSLNETLDQFRNALGYTRVTDICTTVHNLQSCMTAGFETQ